MLYTPYIRGSRCPPGADVQFTMSKEALSEIRVIELGEGVSAPFCAKLLADYGADVVKVEPPGGDPARALGPFPGDEAHPEKSGLFFFLNSNKRSVVLDLDSGEGLELFFDLLRTADMLVENQSPAKKRELGIDYAALAAVNPQLVVVSITPLGQTGPAAEWKAVDLNAWHMTGAGSRYCGKPDQAPLEIGTFAADFYGAITGAAWGLAATLGRDKVGSGQQLDVSSAEAIAATFTGGQNIGALAQDGVFDSRTGVGMSLAAPATIMPCKDGHAWVLALEAAQWNGLVEVMGNPDWAQLEIFQDMFTRAQNSDLIYSMLEEWTIQQGKFELMDRCQAVGAPVTAVFTVAEAARHEHLRERGFMVELEHAELGRVTTLGAPFKLPACPGGAVTAAPLLGEHHDEILAAAAPRAATPDASAPDAATPTDSGRLPLEGLRVANFGWVWAGPVTGQTLAFLGADVIKVESRTRVDLTRTLPPFADGEASPDRSLSNHACWAGNGSVTLDLKQERGLELARELVASCDVVIENFGPGVMQRLGLGYDELKRVREDVILFSMPAAGQYGPLKDVRTYGMSLSSLTGLDSLNGYADGPPVPMENAFCDPMNGILGAYAILAALAWRRSSGEGQHVDYSQQEAAMQLVGPAYMDFELNGRVAGPLGNRHPTAAAAPHGVFPCAGEDRWIAIAVSNDLEWRALTGAMGDPDWAAEERYESSAGRLEDLDRLHEQLGAWTAGCGDRELVERLQAVGVAATPVLNVGDLLTDPHWKARDTFIEVTHPLGFNETIYGSYVKMGSSRVVVKPGPAMGQDNHRVFVDTLGMDEAEYARLVEEKVIY